MSTSRVWFLTGSSRGLGRSLATAILEAGHQLVATARQPEQLADLVARYGERVLPVALDVTDPAAARAAIQKGVEKFGRIDVVVNNAGYANVAAIEDFEEADFRAQIDTNFYGVVNVSRAALPVLRAQGAGRIIQISSIGGRIGGPGLGAYQAAKWAVGGFSEVLAKEVEPLGIFVTVVEPGGMRTDWAGVSMIVHPVSPAYAGTVGLVSGFVRAHGGHENTDPQKASQAILKLAELPHPPVRLLLGSDAVGMADRMAERLAKDDAEWRELSVSSDMERSEEEKAALTAMLSQLKV